MDCTYEYPSIENGELKRKIVILHCSDNCDIDHVLHDVAFEYCLTKGRKCLPHNNGEITFGQLVDSASPELFQKHGVTVTRPSENAIRMDQAAPIIGRYELETYFRSMDDLYQKFNMLRDFASRIGMRLFTLWERGDSVVSTWNPKHIPCKSVEWGYKFLGQDKHSPQALDKFFEQKVLEAKPGKYNRDSEQSRAIEAALTDCTSEQ